MIRLARIPYRDDQMLHWIDDKAFEIDGYKITMDYAFGGSPRESSCRDFTMMKTADYLNQYEALTDKTEFHVGTEYTWSAGSDWVFAVRAGYYSDPDHDGIKGIDSAQHHGTFGGGVVIKNQLQIDVAGNFAKNIRDGLISIVVRF